MVSKRWTRSVVAEAQRVGKSRDGRWMTWVKWAEGKGREKGGSWTEVQVIIK